MSMTRLNSLRWKGYFYDVETGLYFINGRWYDPETCRYISPTGHTAINLLSPNGLNRYAFEDNQPLGTSTINYATTPLSYSNVSFSSKNFPYLEGKWFSTSGLDILLVSNEGIKLIDGNLSIYSYSLNLDERNKLYVNIGNFYSFAGFDFNEGEYGIKFGANLISIGYKGKYIDVSMDLFGYGYLFYYKDGRLTVGADPLGTPGFTISIDIIEILKYIYNLLEDKAWQL